MAHVVPKEDDSGYPHPGLDLFVGILEPGATSSRPRRALKEELSGSNGPKS